MNSIEQETRAQKNCGKLYRMLVDGCDIVMDDEKYFKFSGEYVLGNRYFYSSDPSTAPPDVKFQKKAKFEEKDHGLDCHIFQRHFQRLRSEE